MAYFWIANGLRGCYMPDNSYVIRVNTRKELKRFLMGEAAAMREAHGFGGSKKMVAHIAAEAWRNRKGHTYNFVIPFGRERGNYPFGLFISAATRAEYLQYLEEEGF